MSGEYKYKLTAVVLVYNGEPYLRSCLESLVNQSLDNFEILLINDVSTDDSLSICREFERDYDFVRVIDKDKNEGLATNANLGIELAQGEYVILVDNDDIIPYDAYEKLYNKAKEDDADICTGKANFIIGKYVQEVNFPDFAPWEKERTIENLEDFPPIFQDAFYWNKIIRKDFLMKYNIRLPKGMIYADRFYSHSAYIHANRISVIPDCVYLWRRRKTSLSMKREDLENYINRIESYKLNFDEIAEVYPDYIKILVRRILVPINGVFNNQEFEDYVFSDVYDFLVHAYENVDDIYDNGIKEFDNIILYLILNQDRENLKKMIHLRLNEEREVFNENNVSYWKLPGFRDPNMNIPDELFKIKFLNKIFVNIGEVRTTKDSIIFDEIEIPKYFDLKEASIVFRGRTPPHERLLDNTVEFEFEKIEDEERNLYRVEAPVEMLNIFDLYDLYIKSKSSSQITFEFRLTNANIEKIEQKSKEFQIKRTKKGYVYVNSQRLSKQFKITADEEKIKLPVSEGSKIKKNLIVYLKNDATDEIVHFTLNDDKTAFELEWKFFLDSNSVYTFHIIGFDNKDYKLTTKHLKKFKDFSFKDIDVYKSGKNIKLKSGENIKDLIKK